MTTIETALPITSTSRLYRTAGIASLVAGIVYIVQPLLVFVLVPGASSDGSFPSPGKIPSQVLGNTVAGIEFFAVGLATIFAVIALSRIAARSGVTTWGIVTAVAGIASGFAWMCMAGMTVANSGTVAVALSEITPDVPTQQVGLQAVNIVLTGFIAVVSTTTATWLIGLATVGRKLGVVGMPLAVVSAVAGLLIAAALVFLNVPFGILLLIPYNIALGIALLVKSRA